MSVPETNSALDEAVGHSDYPLMVQLLESGVERDSLNKVGMTPLILAVFRGDLEAAELLLVHGADPNCPSDDGLTPLWYAEDFGLSEIEDLLRRHGAIKF
jgi:ankyrin repeat protein